MPEFPKLNIRLIVRFLLYGPLGAICGGLVIGSLGFFPYGLLAVIPCGLGGCYFGWHVQKRMDRMFNRDFLDLQLDYYQDENGNRSSEKVLLKNLYLVAVGVAFINYISVMLEFLVGYFAYYLSLSLFFHFQNSEALQYLSYSNEWVRLILVVSPLTDLILGHGNEPRQLLQINLVSVCYWSAFLLLVCVFYLCYFHDKIMFQAIRNKVKYFQIKSKYLRVISLKYFLYIFGILMFYENITGDDFWLNMLTRYGGPPSDFQPFRQRSFSFYAFGTIVFAGAPILAVHSAHRVVRTILTHLYTLGKITPIDKLWRILP